MADGTFLGRSAGLLADAYFGRAAAIIYFGRAAAIIERRKRIKRKTIEQRRLLHRKLAA